MKGIINILKPPNTTSHDIVSFVRRRFQIKKVGHTGTLDPMAVGVLPICIGRATKVIKYMENDKKIYRAELTLGQSTDTQDKWGQVLSYNSVDVSKDLIMHTFKNFTGPIEQIPPMYSALKHKGKKLYELAREGIIIERKPRKINIYSIDIINIYDGKILFDVECSKGTYIRTLCHDIGNSLGCGGHMSFLARLKSGLFTLDDSITVEKLLSTDISKIESEYLHSIDYPLNLFPRADVKPSALKYVLNGAFIKKDFFTLGETIEDNDLIRVYINNEFIALGKYLIEDNKPIIKINKLFS